MSYFPSTQDDELQRIADLMEQQRLAGESGIAKQKIGMDLVPQQQADPLEAEVAKQFATQGMEEESALIKSPPNAFSRGVVTPQGELQPQPKQETMQLPSQDYQKQQQAEAKSNQPQVATQSNEPDWEGMLRKAMESDAQKNLIRGIERGTKEVVGGLTLTKPDIQNLVAQEGNSADRVRQSMEAAKKYALAKQQADDERAVKMSQIDMNRVGKEAYATQVKSQAEQAKLNALNKAEALKIDAAKQMADAADKAAQTKIEADYKKALIAQGWGELAAKKKADADMQAYRMASIDADKAKASAAGAKKQDGQILPVTAVEGFSDGKQIIGMLEGLNQKNKDLKPTRLGSAMGLVYPTDTNLYETDLIAARQILGKYLEGGKLAAGDDVKYTKLMPNVKDDAASLKYKTGELIKLIEKSMKIQAENFKASGYRVPDQLLTTKGGKSAEQQAPAEITTPSDDGKVVRLNPATGKLQRYTKEQAAEIDRLEQEIKAQK